MQLLAAMLKIQFRRDLAIDAWEQRSFSKNKWNKIPSLAWDNLEHINSSSQSHMTSHMLYSSLFSLDLQILLIRCLSKIIKLRYSSYQCFQKLIIIKKVLNFPLLHLIANVIQLFIGEHITKDVFICHIQVCICKRWTLGTFSYN